MEDKHSTGYHSKEAMKNYKRAYIGFIFIKGENGTLFKFQ